MPFNTKFYEPINGNFLLCPLCPRINGWDNDITSNHVLIRRNRLIVVPDDIANF